MILYPKKWSFKKPPILYFTPKIQYTDKYFFLNLEPKWTTLKKIRIEKFLLRVNFLCLKELKYFIAHPLYYLYPPCECCRCEALWTFLTVPERSRTLADNVNVYEASRRQHIFASIVE